MGYLKHRKIVFLPNIGRSYFSLRHHTRFTTLLTSAARQNGCIAANSSTIVRTPCGPRGGCAGSESGSPARWPGFRFKSGFGTFQSPSSAGGGLIGWGVARYIGETIQGATDISSQSRSGPRARRPAASPNRLQDSDALPLDAPGTARR